MEPSGATDVQLRPLGTGGSRRNAVWVALVVVLLACAAAAALMIARNDGVSQVPLGNAAVLHPDGASMGATWAFRPRSVDQMVARAKVGGLATVTGIAAGPALRGDEPDDVMPTQRITLKFDEQWVGSAPSEIVLFKSGSNSSWIEDDPPYKVGEKYLIYASPRPEDPATYLNVAPDARIKVQDGRLRPLVEGSVAQQLGGRAPADAKAATNAAEAR